MQARLSTMFTTSISFILTVGGSAMWVCAWAAADPPVPKSVFAYDCVYLRECNVVPACTGVGQICNHCNGPAFEKQCRPTNEVRYCTNLLPENGGCGWKREGFCDGAGNCISSQTLNPCARSHCTSP